MCRCEHYYNLPFFVAHRLQLTAWGEELRQRHQRTAFLDYFALVCYVFTVNMARCPKKSIANCVFRR